MNTGCYTAMITPFNEEGVDYEGMSRLIDFQIDGGVAGILAAGTTGESPVLTWEEHNRVVETTAAQTRGKCACIAGAGSNNTREALLAVEHAAKAGAEAVLLVDPYYNGPSSLEIRREYIEPIAKAFPDLEILPYIIPGRTGAQMFPEDLAILFERYKNVNTVKEATGSLENMKRTRACCGPDYTILSGDDAMLVEMMTDKAIGAAGVISVVSNIVPHSMSRLVSLLSEGNMEEAGALAEALKPLFGLVTVSTKETTPYGDVVCRARNPMALKTLMAVMGLPAGGCRQPLGRMTRNGIEVVLGIARTVQEKNPEILAPAAEFFGVDLEKRLNDPSCLNGLVYDEY